MIEYDTEDSMNLQIKNKKMNDCFANGKITAGFKIIKEISEDPTFVENWECECLNKGALNLFTEMEESFYKVFKKAFTPKQQKVRAEAKKAFEEMEKIVLKKVKSLETKIKKELDIMTIKLIDSQEKLLINIEKVKRYLLKHPQDENRRDVLNYSTLGENIYELKRMVDKINYSIGSNHVMWKKVFKGDNPLGDKQSWV